MQITITCGSIKELQELANRIVILEDCAASKKDAKKKKEVQAAGAKNKRGTISIDEIRKLKESGLTPKQIAEKLVCSEATVYNKLKE